MDRSSADLVGISVDLHGATGGRDVQWKIAVPSLPYGFKFVPPGNFPYRNSQEIPELRVFPVFWESQEFPSHGEIPIF